MKRITPTPYENWNKFQTINTKWVHYKTQWSKITWYKSSIHLYFMSCGPQPIVLPLEFIDSMALAQFILSTGILFKFPQ